MMAGKIWSSSSKQHEHVYIKQNSKTGALTETEYGLTFRFEHARPGNYFNAWAWCQNGVPGPDLKPLPYNWTYG